LRIGRLAPIPAMPFRASRRETLFFSSDMVVASIEMEWRMGSWEWEYPPPLYPDSPLLLNRLLFLLWLVLILFVVFILFILFVVFILFILFVVFILFISFTLFILLVLFAHGVFLRVFFVISQPFGVNRIGLAAFFFSDQPLTAFVPPLTAFWVLVAI